MPPEIPGVDRTDVNPDGTFRIHYATTTRDGNEIYRHIPPLDFQDLVENANFYNDGLTMNPAEMNIPDTTIHVSDCYGNTWASLPLSEERLKEIIRETVKELLEQEGYIIGKIPNQPSDLPIGE